MDNIKTAMYYISNEISKRNTQYYYIIERVKQSERNQEQKEFLVKFDKLKQTLIDLESIV